MKNRRMRPDTVMNLLSGISIISWMILCAVFIIFGLADPASSILPAGRPGMKSPTAWMSSAVYSLLFLLIVLSISGILFNMLRLKRKSDKIRLTPVFSGVFAIAGLIVLNI